MTGSCTTRTAVICQVGCFGQPWESTTAQGVGGAVQRRVAVGPSCAPRRQAATVLKHEQQILDHAVTQAVGQHDIVAIGGVALGADDPHIAGGADFAADPVPADRVGAQLIAFASHLHIAAGGDDLRLAVVGQLVGAEVHHLGGLGQRRRFLRVQDAGGAKDEREGRPADKLQRFHFSRRKTQAASPPAYCTGAAALQWPGGIGGSQPLPAAEFSPVSLVSADQEVP